MKLPLSSWKNLIIYGSGIFVILVEFWVLELVIQEAILGGIGPTIQSHSFAERSVTFGPNSTV